MLVRWAPSPRALSACRAVLSVRCCSTASKGSSSGSVKEGENAVEAATAGEPSEVEKVDSMKTRLSAVPKPESGIARRSVEEALLDERRKKYLEMYESTGTTRYLPPRDPNAFLIEKERLSGTERRAQRLFAYLPWLTFGVMLVAPYYGIKWAQATIDAQVEEQSGSAEAVDDDTHPLSSVGFRVMDYQQLPEVLESPLPHLLVLYDDTYASRVFLPSLRSLAASIARASKGQLSIVAVELPRGESSKELLKEYPRSQAPHIQFIVPAATSSGEAGVLDYKGRWNMQELVRTFVLPTLRHRTAVGIPPEGRRKLVEEARRLDQAIASLWSDCLFTLHFMPRKKPAPAWQLDDSLTLPLDQAIDRCRHRLTEEERRFT